MKLQMTELIGKVGKTLSKHKTHVIGLVSAHSPEILTGMGIIGLVTTVGLTAKAAVKIDRILRETEEVEEKDLTLKEKVEACWKEAVPPVVSAIATGVCIVASNKASASKRAALMTAYTLMADKVAAYEAAIKDEDKQQDVTKNLVENRKSSVGGGQYIIRTDEGGPTHCVDVISGRHFWSSAEAIRKAQNDINEMIISDWSATLNDLYDALGLDRIKVGDELGWNSNNLLRICFDTMLSEGGEPLLVLDYEAYPEYRLL